MADEDHSRQKSGLKTSTLPSSSESIAEGVRQLKESVQAKKCWSCGCLHDTLSAIEKAPAQLRTPELESVIQEARSRLVPRKYDCLGCAICFPALAVNALNQVEGGGDLSACATETPKPQEGWPPFPGSYKVLRYHAPVAVCSLTDEGLSNQLASTNHGALSIVGTMMTENLGIERLIQNILANPNIRFLVVCGMDSRQAVGHLPGQSLLALVENGMDNQKRIIGAKGKRPFLKNISTEAVAYFRKTVEVVNLLGQADPQTILQSAEQCKEHYSGPSAPFFEDSKVATLQGSIPDHMVSDPAGYFVVYVDRAKNSLLLEHYRNDGVLDVVIEGHKASELFFPAIDKGLISRLDHSAYLGKELARAEEALKSGKPYIQDAAPEKAAEQKTVGNCGCGTSCETEVRHELS